ncbi:30S ribosomal protein S17 [Candidatus Amarolinea aalborgensis]|jgi:small subunit ribosomal protein S17|uniref:30S ribosomal protein S17 n=1 Tax=Candidatus Amarolinea aalborgensis TaxID=2249329 RepID=UPI003BF97C50
MREQRKTLVGRVASNKMDKTVVVTVERVRRHALYGKVIKITRRFMAHDESNACQIGDMVRILESQPLSRHKRWVVAEILNRSNQEVA